MEALFLTPGFAYFLAALGASLMVGLGLVIRPRPLVAVAGESPRLNPTMRLVAGQLAAIALAGLLVTSIIAADLRGGPRVLLGALAIAAYLGVGIILPRREQLRREREAVALRRITPGLIGFIRVGMGSFEAPSAILQRYLSQSSPRLAPMRDLVHTALVVGQERRLRPFAALALAARPRGCRELSDVAEALAQSESEGSPIETVLAAQQATLELILQSEFKRMLRRRTMYLLLMVAIALVVGILINLLWIMTGGGSVFSQLGS
ncbi:hypothetical protein [Candidatus Oscillochloris fontis]|uniref:hypothetical protein n=1 Tax=Candidatus Oscillochloris fontis TaxID=2496868 RepID=UPI00101D5434|nr:hypothetical protein [Candidatus Oscillochloris fontis]